MHRLATKAFRQTAVENVIIGAAGAVATALAPHITGSGIVGLALGALVGLIWSFTTSVGPGKGNGVASFSPHVTAVQDDG